MYSLQLQYLTYVFCMQFGRPIDSRGPIIRIRTHATRDHIQLDRRRLHARNLRNNNERRCQSLQPTVL